VIAGARVATLDREVGNLYDEDGRGVPTTLNFPLVDYRETIFYLV